MKEGRKDNPMEKGTIDGIGEKVGRWGGERGGTMEIDERGRKELEG